MAAFERARDALDIRLSSRMERVMQLCGSNADLLLETAMNINQTAKPLELLTNGRLLSQCMSVNNGLMGRPMLTALQVGSARCAHCSPLGRLLIQSVMTSGSHLEGFMSIQTASEGSPPTSSSDVDLMLQLGPVLWEAGYVVCGGSQEAGRGSGAAGSLTGAGTAQLEDKAVPRLRAVSAKNPGFVLLYQAKKEQCTHSDEHLFSADSVRRLMYRFCKARHSDREVGSSGPATSFDVHNPYNQELVDGTDMVPCLRANWWPSEEFFQRSRARDWPPAAVQDDIRQFGIHLVPVGAKGSSTEKHEWRLSFSRGEVVMSWHLTPRQKTSLATLKVCKTALGPEGKPVKTYFMKTALLWLCQDTNVEQWTSIKQGMLMIITFLEKAVHDEYLGCFFWSKINLFRQQSPADLAAMRHTLSLLRQHMTRRLAHELSPYMDDLVPIILQVGEAEASEQLSERQLRVCLARNMVIMAVKLGIVKMLPHTTPADARKIQMFLQSSATVELACVLHNSGPQRCLLVALTMAPADVMARCRLTSLDDVMFSWDAAPLLELLMPKDLKGILGDPAVVTAWLKDQRRLPTDLSSPRALADLLLDLPLLAEALRESLPRRWETFLKNMREGHRNAGIPEDTNEVLVGSGIQFDAARKEELKMWGSSSTLAVFASLPLWTQSDFGRYSQSREKARKFLDDPQTRTEFYRLYRHLPDPWRLRQFVFTESQ